MKMINNDIAHFDVSLTTFLPDMQSFHCEFLAAHVIEGLANAASLDRDTYQTYKRAAHQAAIDIFGIDMPRRFCVSPESTDCFLNASDDWAKEAASLVSDYTTRVEALQRYLLHYLVHKSRYLIALARLSHVINRFEATASRLIIQATEWKSLRKQVRFRRTTDTSCRSTHTVKNKSTKEVNAALLQSVTEPQVAATAINSDPSHHNVKFDKNYNNAASGLQDIPVDTADLQTKESNIVTELPTPEPLSKEKVVQNKAYKDIQSYYTIDESLAFGSATEGVGDMYSKLNSSNDTNLKSIDAKWPRKCKRGKVSGLTFVTRSRKRRQNRNKAGTKHRAEKNDLHTATDEGQQEITLYPLPSETSLVSNSIDSFMLDTESYINTGICDRQGTEVQPADECELKYNFTDTKPLDNSGSAFADDSDASQSKQVQLSDSSVQMPQLVLGKQSTDEPLLSYNVVCCCNDNQNNFSNQSVEKNTHLIVQSGQGSDLDLQFSANTSSDCNVDTLIDKPQFFSTYEATFNTQQADFVNCSSVALGNLLTLKTAYDEVGQAFIVGCVRDTVPQQWNGGEATDSTTGLESNSYSDYDSKCNSTLNVSKFESLTEGSMETDAVSCNGKEAVNNSILEVSIDAADTNSTSNPDSCLTKTKRKRAKRAKKSKSLHGGNVANIEADQQPGQIEDAEQNVANNQPAVQAPEIVDPLAAVTSIKTLLKSIVSRSVNLETGLKKFMPDLKLGCFKSTSITSSNDPVVQTIMPILEVVNPATSKRTQINPRALISAVNCMSESVSIPKEELSLLLVRLKVLNRGESKNLSFYWTTDIDNPYRYILNHRLATGLKVTMEEATTYLNLTKTEGALFSSALPNLQMHNELLLLEHVKRGVSFASGVIRTYDEFFKLTLDTVTVYEEMHSTCKTIVDKLKSIENPKLAQSLLKGYSTKSLTKKIESDKTVFLKLINVTLKLTDDFNGIVMLTSQRAMLDRLRNQSGDSYNDALFAFACDSDAAFEKMHNARIGPVEQSLVHTAGTYEELADSPHVSGFVSFASIEIQNLVNCVRAKRDEPVLQRLEDAMKQLVSWKDAAATRRQVLVSAAQKVLSLIPNDLQLLVYSMLNLNKSTGALHSAMRDIYKRYLDAVKN